MRELAPGWKAEIDRGPSWLFMRLYGHTPGEFIENPRLAEAVWHLMEQEFARRLVLELDQLERMASYMIGQLVILQQKISSCGGLLRVCGVSAQNRDVLRTNKLGGLLPQYGSRKDAVMGQRPLPR